MQQIEQPVEFLRREEALPFVFGGEELQLGDGAGVEAPVDHPFHHVHNIDQNQVDRAGSKGLPQGDRPAVPSPVDGPGYHEVSLEGLKLKRGDFTQQHVSERGADVRVVMVDARGTVFQGGETFFLENFPCLPIGQILSPGFGKKLGMAFLTDTLTPDFACQYGCIAFTSPAHLFPYQLPIKLVGDVETDVRLTVIALCATCAVIDAGVLCLFSMGHLCLPFANLEAEMLTSWLTTSAYCGKTQESANAVFFDGCIVQQNRAKDNRTSMIVCNMS